MAEIEEYQNQYYQRTSVGDFVIYDNRANMMTFKSRTSKKANEIFLY